ncbi:hypothetical protein [Neisseria dumasiana]|nr:hypothetical protein [Neisseria dumasiana]
MGTGAAYKAGKTGVGDFGQAGINEIGKTITNSSIDRFTTKPNQSK